MVLLFSRKDIFFKEPDDEDNENHGAKKAGNQNTDPLLRIQFVDQKIFRDDQKNQEYYED